MCWDPTQKQTAQETGGEASSESIVVKVQGRTIAEWAEEGKLNATRTEHVHPKKPEGEPTDIEVEALVASLTEDEAMLAFLSLVLGKAVEVTSVFA